MGGEPRFGTLASVSENETRGTKPTLRDVAREAGVHVSTVSRVLNDRAAAGRITQDTEHRIRDVARRLGYRPNTIARALRTGRTLVVGMVVPDVANLYQAGITRGAGDVLSADGYSLLLASTDDDPGHAEVQVSAMLGVQAEGLLYGVARDEDRVLAGLVDEGIPVSCSTVPPPSPPSAPCYPTIMPGRGWPSNTSSRWVIATSCTWGDRRTCPPPSTASAPSRRYSEKPVWPGVAASPTVTPRRRATG